MGGHAFRKLALSTPRMPPNIYLLVLTQTRDLLLRHYHHAESPLEAPGKESYGDIDILVTGPRTPAFDPTINRVEAGKSLASLLTSHAHITEKGNPTLNFAIPYPAVPTELAKDGLGDESEEAKYIQVDIHYLPTLPQFQWELFHSAHGDLWNMLGSTIRPFGLTVNDKGLYIRIEEIEKLDRGKAKVFLTSSPTEILNFLGLDEKTWWKMFQTKEDMFEYAAGCRFFWIKPKVDEQVLEGGAAVPEGGEGEKEDLKRSDRKRVTQRPIFAEWIEDFIPRCRESGQYASLTLTREGIRLEAYERFGVQQEYEDKLREWTLIRHKDELWRVTIKGAIPEDGVDPQFRSAAARVFKGIIIEGGQVEGLVAPAAVKVQEDGFWDLDAVREWVAVSWGEAGKVGLKLLQEKSIEKQREKEAKAKASMAAA